MKDVFVYIYIRFFFFLWSISQIGFDLSSNRPDDVVFFLVRFNR